MPYMYIVRVIDQRTGQVKMTMKFVNRVALSFFFEEDGAQFEEGTYYKVTRA